MTGTFSPDQVIASYSRCLPILEARQVVATDKGRVDYQKLADVLGELIESTPNRYTERLVIGFWLAVNQLLPSNSVMNLIEAFYARYTVVDAVKTQQQRETLRLFLPIYIRQLAEDDQIEAVEV